MGIARAGRLTPEEFERVADLNQRAAVEQDAAARAS